MTSAESIQIIAAVGACIGSIAAAVVSIITAAKVEKVHIATNSITDRLVASTKSEAHAAGVKEEKDKAGKS